MGTVIEVVVWEAVAVFNPEDIFLDAISSRDSRVHQHSADINVKCLFSLRYNVQWFKAAAVQKKPKPTLIPNELIGTKAIKKKKQNALKQ